MWSEFEFINHIKAKYDLKKVGDDCAILPRDATTDLLITSDMLVEDIDFRLRWTNPESLGHKTLAVSLSDIAAMGGTPEFALLSVAVSEKLWKTNFLDRLYAGWHKLAAEFGVELVGGDISRSPHQLVLESTVLGSVSRGKAILRSGAKPGDAIFVSGTLGGAAGGLKILESDSSQPAELVQKQLEPRPQTDLAKHLASLDLVTSMIDLSDGLTSDLAHLCDASGVGASIDADRLPINAQLAPLFGKEESLRMAISGGEDFELLFTGNGTTVPEAGLTGVTKIGEITAESGVVLRINGEAEPLRPAGFRHF